MSLARSLKLAAIALLAGLGTAAPGDAESEDDAVLEPGSAYAAARSAAAEALVARIATLAQGDDPGALIAVAQQALADVTLAPAARERVLYESALALATLAADAQTNALLAELSAHRPAVQVWQYDGAHRIAVPLYEVASAARYAARHQQEQRSWAAAAAAIARGDDEPLETLESGAGARSSAERRGVLLAFEQAPLEQLLAYRDQAQLTIERGAALDVAALVARRLGDAAMMQQILARADAALALAAVRDARTSFTSAEAFDLLATAAQRDDVGSAALLALGELAADEPRALATLFHALADGRRAGSAAAALGALHDPAIAAKLRAWVLEQSDAKLARRGILALRLDASAAARTELARLAADPALPVELRAETRT